jgi:signal transduction histidine kinase/ligand-binding sensor domain-containing protein/CheY-like chemotaxis protein
MKRILSIFSLIIIACSIEGNAPVRFTHYSTNNGLPNDFVLSIVQDDDGFMWFGTHLGIVRFDGHNFNLFQPDPKKSNSLSYKHISKMYIDLNGNLWVKFTENALNRMETQTGKFYNYSSNDTDPDSISSLRVNSFFEDQDSTLWIATKSGLNIYNNEKDNFYSVLPKSITSETYPSNLIKSVTDDSLGNIWILSQNGIGRIRKKNFELKSLGSIISLPEIDSLDITSIASDHKSKLWFTTWRNGVYYYDITSGKLTNYLNKVKRFKSVFIDSQGNVFVFSETGNALFYFDHQRIQEGAYSKYTLFETNEHARFLRYAEDKTGNVWISSSQGLDMFSPQGKIIHYKNDIFQDQSLSSNFINYIFIDKTNNLWLSNYRRGLDKADLNKKPFKKSFTSPNQSNNIFSGTNITAVLTDQQNYLWVGARGKAIIRFDKNTNNFIPVQLKGSHQVNFSALFEDSKGDIWIGNYHSGIQRIDPNTLQVTYSNNISKWGEYQEVFRGVRKIVEDNNGDIWMATITGIHKWIRETETIIPYSYLHDRYNPAHGFYRTVFIDKKGILWSGCYNGGLARYDTKDNKVRRYVNVPGDETSLSGNGVYVIYEESDTTFLVGTTFGLNRFNKVTEQFSLVKTKQSLYNYSIYTILPDSLGNYWMATDNGLICLNKNTLECTFYLEGDGLTANEFNTTASSICQEGIIYLGSPKGLLSFDPNKFSINQYYAKPTITNFQINNVTISPGDTLNKRVLLTKQIWATNHIELKHFENDFALQFSAMHFAVPENNKFWYMLEGYKDEWVATGGNRRWASFTGLPPGHYKFRLRATNNDGVLCKPEDEVVLTIIIHPPFWLTVWFKVLTIVIIAGIVGGYFRLRILRFKKLNILLEQKVDKRTRELKDVNISLREHQEEINSQKESLEEANESLRRTQEEIIAQNKELDLHRNKLEYLVEERTSELLRALTKAEESDRLKTSFLANMSHEIRTPMNAIIGFSTLLEEYEFNDETKNMYVKTILKNSESLMVLINDILDLSKIQSNQLAFNMQPESIKSILNEVYHVFCVENSNDNISLKLDIGKIKNDLSIVTDKVRLKQVISNLLSNALKFTRKGAVELGVLNVKDKITIYVKDSGIGIPEETGEAIFERFLKLEDDTDNLFRGAGLGLSISKSLVNLWGGNIWYESTENVGTTFYFTHPILEHHSNLEKKEKVQIDKLPNLKGKNILIAEDEESNYNLIFAYLNILGANVLWAKNGEEACRMANANINLILMDIKMPVLNGIDAAIKIKQKYRDIPIIAQTAYSYTNHEDILDKDIFDGYILKPIIRMDLLSTITKFI